MDCKPDSVVEDNHLSCRRHRWRDLCPLPCLLRDILEVALGGVCPPALLLLRDVSSYLTISPLPRLRQRLRRAVCFCCTNPYPVKLACARHGAAGVTCHRFSRLRQLASGGSVRTFLSFERLPIHLHHLCYPKMAVCQFVLLAYTIWHETFRAVFWRSAGTD